MMAKMIFKAGIEKLKWSDLDLYMLSNHANLSPGKQCRFYKRVESQSFVMEHKKFYRKNGFIFV